MALHNIGDPDKTLVLPYDTAHQALGVKTRCNLILNLSPSVS